MQGKTVTYNTQQCKQVSQIAKEQLIPDKLFWKQINLKPAMLQLIKIRKNCSSHISCQAGPEQENKERKKKFRSVYRFSRPKLETSKENS